MKKNQLPIKSQALLTNALTHRSWLNETENRQEQSNERLEFLGDAVLELIVSEHLFRKFPHQQEGQLTAFRASLVRTETLSRVATKLNLGSLIRLSKGEEIGGGRINESLLANTFEAVIGAIYLESGKEITAKFIAKYLLPELTLIIKNHLEKDAKSQLQEIVQSKGFAAPTYTVVSEDGPDHAKIFTVAVSADERELATGTGKSKQQAQQSAAATALEKLQQN